VYIGSYKCNVTSEFGNAKYNLVLFPYKIAKIPMPGLLYSYEESSILGGPWHTVIIIVYKNA
jgi:hypothetical protein